MSGTKATSPSRTPSRRGSWFWEGGQYRPSIPLSNFSNSPPPLPPSSDGVLNPSGIRFGSAEIYSVLEAFRDEIDDSLCVGQRRPHDKDERVLLFLKMRPGKRMDEALLKRMRDAIRKARSARHIPAYIFQVEDIPVRDMSWG